MRKYQTLLFDLDDTLLDFGVARLAAHRASCEAHGHGFDDELYKRFNEINDELWKAYEEGKIPQTQVRQSRHERLFKERGHVVDGAAFDATYSHHLAQGFHPIAGSIDLIAGLARTHALYIVSNGVSTIQASRLAGSGLRPHFKDVFVSEAIGAQKPHKAFFDHVVGKIPAFEHSKALIIGDSLSADIAGGNAAGIDTCWFNPAGKPNASGHRPTYEVRSYVELQAIVASEG